MENQIQEKFDICQNNEASKSIIQSSIAVEVNRDNYNTMVHPCELQANKTRNERSVKYEKRCLINPLVSSKRFFKSSQAAASCLLSHNALTRYYRIPSSNSI